MSINSSQDNRVGAAAKLARARELKSAGMLDAKGRFLRSDNERIYATLFMIALAGALAWRLGETLLAGGSLKTGNAWLDDYVLAASPAYTGDPALDVWLALVLRAVCVLALAAFIPALSWLWARVIDRPLLSPYRLVCGMTLAVAVAALSFKPLLTMIMAKFG